jgi:hypothetical protein
LSPDLLALSLRRFEARQTGPVFGELADVIGLSLADLMQAETEAVSVQGAARAVAAE